LFDAKSSHSRSLAIVMAAATLSVLPLASLRLGPQPCGYNHVDVYGWSWSWNFSRLAAPRDYEVTVGGERIALNVCRPPISVCRPPGQQPAHGTPTAVAFWGPPPDAGTQWCGGLPCTQQCAPLGWGALGGPRTQWSLLDPFTPLDGIRLTHYSLLPRETPATPPPCNSCCNGTAGASAPPPPPRTAVAAGPTPGGAPERVAALDEYGEPRPAVLTIDFLCEPNAPPAAPPPLESITIQGQQRADTSLRLRSALACPAHLPPAAIRAATVGSDGRAPAKAAAPSADGEGAVDEADEDVREGGLGAWQLLVALL
jgi:hypothetical protein